MWWIFGSLKYKLPGCLNRVIHWPVLKQWWSDAGYIGKCRECTRTGPAVTDAGGLSHGKQPNAHSISGETCHGAQISGGDGPHADYVLV